MITTSDLRLAGTVTLCLEGRLSPREVFLGWIKFPMWDTLELLFDIYYNLYIFIFKFIIYAILINLPLKLPIAIEPAILGLNTK